MAESTTCVLCGRDAGRFKHDPFPLAQGICCDACLFYCVLPLRLSVEPPRRPIIPTGLTREEEEALMAEFAHSDDEEEPKISAEAFANLTLQEALAMFPGEGEEVVLPDPDYTVGRTAPIIFPSESFEEPRCAECDAEEEEDTIGDDD